MTAVIVTDEWRRRTAVLNSQSQQGRTVNIREQTRKSIRCGTCNQGSEIKRDGVFRTFLLEGRTATAGLGCRKEEPRGCRQQLSQGNHKPGKAWKPGIFREFSGNSVEPQGKTVRNEIILVRSNICAKQQCWLGKQDPYDLTKYRHAKLK